MNKLMNRRHIYQITNHWNDLTLALENVDNYIHHSKALSYSTANIIVYGVVGDGNQLLVGREVVGVESDLKHHTEIFLKDYQYTKTKTRESEFNSYDELSELLKQSVSQLKASSYRLEFLSNHSVSIDYFGL